MKYIVAFIIFVIVLIGIYPDQRKTPRYTFTRTVYANVEGGSEITISPTTTPTKLPIGTPTLAFSEIPSDEEWGIINKYENKHLIAHIYKNESTFARHDVCRSRGGFNGFGFNEWKGHSPTCYSSFDEVVSLVNDWIETNKHYGLETMTCIYIRGLYTPSCDTSYKFFVRG